MQPPTLGFAKSHHTSRAIRCSVVAGVDLPGAGETKCGMSEKLPSWQVITSIWSSSRSPLYLAAWTIAPRVAEELAEMAKELQLAALVLDRSTASRNSSVPGLQKALGDRLRLTKIHAKLAVCSPFVLVGSANLCDSKGWESWQLTNSRELSAWWAEQFKQF